MRQSQVPASCLRPSRRQARVRPRSPAPQAGLAASTLQTTALLGRHHLHFPEVETEAQRTCGLSGGPSVMVREPRFTRQPADCTVHALSRTPLCLPGAAGLLFSRKMPCWGGGHPDCSRLLTLLQSKAGLHRRAPGPGPSAEGLQARVVRTSAGAACITCILHNASNCMIYTVLSRH